MFRKLAIRLVMWLCARYSIIPLDEARKFMGADKVARSQRWESFYLEENGLADMIDAARRGAFEAYSECRPSDHAEKEYLANSDRCWRHIDQRIRSVIETGKIEARNNMDRERLAKPRLKSVDF